MVETNKYLDIVDKVFDFNIEDNEVNYDGQHGKRKELLFDRNEQDYLAKQKIVNEGKETYVDNGVNIFSQANFDEDLIPYDKIYSRYKVKIDIFEDSIREEELFNDFLRRISKDLNLLFNFGKKQPLDDIDDPTLRQKLLSCTDGWITQLENNESLDYLSNFKFNRNVFYSVRPRRMKISRDEEIMTFTLVTNVKLDVE